MEKKLLSGGFGGYTGRTSQNLANKSKSLLIVAQVYLSLAHGSTFLLLQSAVSAISFPLR